MLLLKSQAAQERCKGDSSPLTISGGAEVVLGEIFPY